MSFTVLLIITIVLRGIGSGIIFGIGILTNPIRNKINFPSYIEFIKAHYKGFGVKIYAGLTIIRTLLTLVLLLMNDNKLTYITFSFIASLLGFVGTTLAYPTMKKIWTTNLNNGEQLNLLLNRFEFWHWASAISHLTAFVLLAMTLLQ